MCRLNTRAAVTSATMVQSTSVWIAVSLFGQWTATIIIATRTVRMDTIVLVIAMALLLVPYAALIMMFRGEN